jgi:hypothetical protein
MSVSNDAGLGRSHRTKGKKSPLSAILLKEADDRVDHHDHRDRDGVDPFAQQRGDHRCAKQQPDERAGELPRQEHQRRLR